MNRELIKHTKEEHSAGQRVELVKMADAYAPPYGTRGTVRSFDDSGQVHVQWKNGSTLARITQAYEWRIIESYGYVKVNG